MTSDRGVISLSSNSIKLNNRRGIFKEAVSDKKLENLHTMTFTTRGTGEIVAAGESDKYACINLDRGTVVSTPERSLSSGTEVPATVLKMKRSSHAIVSGTSSGSIEIVDPATMKTQNKFQAHLGPIADLDAKQHLVISCGFSQKKSGYMPDPLVSVYDIRAMKALPPLAVPAGAAFVRLHPKMSTCCVAASLNGQLQFMDIANHAITFLQQAVLSSYLVNMDISASGDFISLCDEEGIIQLWGGPATTSGVGSVNFTDFSAPLDYPTSDLSKTMMMSPFDVDDYSRSLASIGMPYYKEELLSSWSDPKSRIFDTGMPAAQIDHGLVAQMRSLNGRDLRHAPYSAAKYGRRNQSQNYTSVSQIRKSSAAVPKFISEKSRSGAVEDQDMLLTDDDDATESKTHKYAPGSLDVTKKVPKIPKIYRKLEIKYSKFGVNDFDFDFYNKTLYAGLETQVQNSYCNAVLQVYRFSSNIFNFVTDAACCEQYPKGMRSTLMVQLGYLFDMLYKARGNHCQAFNFLNTLSCMPQAYNLGLIHDDDITSTPIVSGNMTPSRGGFEGKEFGQKKGNHGGPPITTEGKLLQNFTRFLMEQMSVEEKEFDIALDGGSIKNICGVRTQTTIKSLSCGYEFIKESLVYGLDLAPAKSNLTRDFFSRLEGGLDFFSQTRGWCEKCQRYQLMSSARLVKELPKVLNIMVNNDPVTITGSSTGGKSGGVLNTELEVPSSFKIRNAEDGRIKVLSNTSNELTGDKTYDLLGYVCEISIEQSLESHLVSIIKIDGRWYLFNDFLVKQIEEEDALDFSLPWKQLVLLVYQESDIPEFHYADASRLNTDLLYVDNFLPDETARIWKAKLSYEKLTREEAPKPGTMVAIDAEFVMIADEDLEIMADGTKLLLKPKLLSLARVSVLRYETGVPFIDDYIATTQPIINYLTEFSGIEPGDLDVNISKRRLVSLETAYRRLWLLLNLNCIFIGHGLINDFRTINVQVPPEQIRDTVDIYYVASRQRKLSLKYLAWYFLDENVQKGNHDSTEDANTALLLYKKYLELKEKGEFEQKLTDVYREGTKLGFRPPSDTSDNHV